MPYPANVYNVLIASPSDVAEERVIIQEVIHDWNTLNSLSRGIVFMPVMWETHSSPEMNIRPQEAINRDVVHHCDIAIGVFWSRIGTHTGAAQSGTIEEIETMSNSKKLVMLYFSERNLPYDHDREQFDKLLDFRRKMTPGSLIESYKDLPEFRNKIFKNLSQKSTNLLNVLEQANTKVMTITSLFSDGEHSKIVRFIDSAVSENPTEYSWQLTILEAFLKLSSASGFSFEELERHIVLPFQELQYHIECLLEKGLLIASSHENESKRYTLTKAGRKYSLEGAAK